jgi:hypothetical protein
VVDFNTALTSAYLGMAEDTVMLRKRRGEMRRSSRPCRADGAGLAMCLTCQPRGWLLAPAETGRHRGARPCRCWLLGALAWPGCLRPGPAPVKLPAPGPRDTCPVCGMFVAPYPYWVATVLWRDGTAVHFDGAKDFFKYLLDLKKYEPGAAAPTSRPWASPTTTAVNASSAERGLRDRLRRAGPDGA